MMRIRINAGWITGLLALAASAGSLAAAPVIAEDEGARQTLLGELRRQAGEIQEDLDAYEAEVAAAFRAEGAAARAEDMSGLCAQLFMLVSEELERGAGIPAAIGAAVEKALEEDSRARIASQYGATGTVAVASGLAATAIERDLTRIAGASPGLTVDQKKALKPALSRATGKMLAVNMARMLPFAMIPGEVANLSFKGALEVGRQQADEAALREEMARRAGGPAEVTRVAAELHRRRFWNNIAEAYANSHTTPGDVARQVGLAMTAGLTAQWLAKLGTQRLIEAAGRLITAVSGAALTAGTLAARAVAVIPGMVGFAALMYVSVWVAKKVVAYNRRRRKRMWDHLSPAEAKRMFGARLAVTRRKLAEVRGSGRSRYRREYAVIGRSQRGFLHQADLDLKAAQGALAEILKRVRELAVQVTGDLGPRARAAAFTDPDGRVDPAPPASRRAATALDGVCSPRVQGELDRVSGGLHRALRTMHHAADDAAFRGAESGVRDGILRQSLHRLSWGIARGGYALDAAIREQVHLEKARDRLPAGSIEYAAAHLEVTAKRFRLALMLESFRRTRRRVLPGLGEVAKPGALFELGMEYWRGRFAALAAGGAPVSEAELQGCGDPTPPAPANPTDFQVIRAVSGAPFGL